MISLTRSRIAASNPSRREPSWPTSTAVLVFAMAYSSCALNLSRRFRAFSFTDFSGEYAFYFSTGMGTEPFSQLQNVVIDSPCTRIVLVSPYFIEQFVP